MIIVIVFLNHCYFKIITKSTSYCSMYLRANSLPAQTKTHTPNQANKEAEESLKQKNQPCWSKLEGCVFAINSVLIKKCSTCKPHSYLLINCFCRTSTSSARTLRTCAGQAPDRNCWSYSHHSSRQNCQVIGSDQFFFWTVDKPNHSKADLITAASSGGLASFLIASWPCHLA